MKKNSLLILVTFIVAFCSLVYELILGQALSAFLGNTILRYSVTIGLYLFAMGFGAMFAEGKWRKNPIKSFLIIELFLTFFGGFSIIFVFILESIFSAGLFFSIFTHFLIILIGTLTGFEIPLLIEIGKKYLKLEEHVILGIDYLGAFLGSIVFSFFFYSKLGLILAAFITAFLNGIAGIVVYFYSRKNNFNEQKGKAGRLLFVAQLFFVVTLIVAIAYSQKISDYLVEMLIT